MNFKGKFLTCGLLFCSWSAAASPALGPCDVWFPAQGKPKGVLVVAHGMNLKPSRMDGLARAMAADGFEVLRPAFTGHCGANDAYLQVRADQWRDDAKRIYALASARAEQLHEPLDLLAYSFSALVFQEMSAELPFQKRVYLAPALAVKFWYPLVRWLAELFPDFTYHSRNLPAYWANPESSARSFLAMDVFLQQWKSGTGAGDKAPTLIFVNPNDELVSFSGLAELAAKRANWKVESVSSKGKTLPGAYNHLMVDGATLGVGQWERMVKEAGAFLE